MDISGGHSVSGCEPGFEKTKAAGALHMPPGSWQSGRGQAAPLSPQTECTVTTEAAVLHVYPGAATTLLLTGLKPTGGEHS